MPSINAFASSSSKVRWIGLGLSFLLAATVAELTDPAQALAAVPAAASAAVAAADPAPASVAGRPDRVSAFLAAQAQGSRVEVTGERSETSTVWANPDGTLTADESTGPVRVRRGQGWVPVDLGLVAVAGGWAPKASPTTVVFSAGGDGPAVKLNEGSKKVWMDWAKTLPSPSIEGSKATYALDANTDLVLTALPEGFEQSLVLKKAPTRAPTIHLPLDLSGLSMVDADNGQGYEFTTSAGEVVFSTPKPQMWDAAVDDLGLPANRRPVAAGMVNSAADAQLDLTPSMAWLADPARQYPVTIDPTIATVTRNGDTFIRDTDAAGVNHGTDYYLPIGLSGATKSRSIVRFYDDPKYAGAHVTAASLSLYQGDGATCTAQPMTAYPVAANWYFSNLTWANQPAINTSSAYTATKSFSHGYETGGCANADDSLTVTNMVAGWASGALTNYGIELRASETDTLARKSFCSMNLDTNYHTACVNPHYPTLSVTYNSYPGAATKLNLSPSTTGTNGLTYVTTYTPTLSAAVPNADGTKVKLRFEISRDPAYTSEPAFNTWTGYVDSTPGATGSLTVPTSANLTSTHYQWRVVGSVVNGAKGIDYGPWSAYQKFGPNVDKPDAPSVACVHYPSGQWTAQVAGNETCTLDTTSGDGAGYYWSLDDPTPTTQAADTTNTGAAATITLPAADIAKGEHTLYAIAYDTAHNTSPTVASYTFGVGPGAVITPGDGDRTQTAVALTAKSTSSRTQVTYSWHTGTTSTTWTTVPTADVKEPGSATPITAWPQTGTTSGSLTTYAPLNWNVAKTARDAGAGDGPVQVRACFNASTTDCSAPSTFTLANTTFADSAATADLGPGTVSLNTGDFQLAATDAAQGGLSVGRTATTLAPATASAGAEGIYGPGWAASLTGPDAGAGDTTLEDHADDGYVALVDSSGGSTFYLTEDTTLTTTSQFIGVDDADDGSTVRCATLSAGACTTWTLADLDGTITTWVKTGTGATAAWTVASIKEAGAESTTTYTRDSQGRVTRILAPVPAGVTCATTLVAGCQALNLTYATATTATGTSEATWGEVTGRLTAITYTGYDPATSVMKTTAVAKFAYDNTGHLRAAWDPRLSGAPASNTPPTDRPSTRYTYDSASRIATVAVPGRATWTMAYDTAGRLADTSRPNPVGPGGVETHAVAYGLSLDTAGAPDLQVSQTTTWNQTSDLPYTGAGVFPASHTPAKNTTTGAYTPGSGDWPYADLTYSDVNGRTVNTASYGAGAWQIESTRYDTTGNTIWELDAGNRAQALTPTPSTDPYVAVQTSTAVRADLLATTSTYTPDGVDLLTSTGPAHPVVLDSGETSSARVRTTNTYDQGKPAGLDATHLLTTKTETPVALDGRTVSTADTRTTKTGYDPIDGAPATDATSGWVLRAATTATTIMGAGTPDIVTRTRYDTAGRTVETRMPASSGSDAGTTITTYYTTSTNSSVPACGGKPAWAGAVCQSGPKTQPVGVTIPVTGSTYTYWGASDTLTETSGSTTRTTTLTYDPAARPTKAATTVSPAADGGTAIADVTTAYDPTTGDPTSITTGTDTISTAYDTLGQVTGYTDADGTTTTTSYDVDGNVTSRDDGKGAYTYTYDGTDAAGQVEHRGLVTALNTGMGMAPSTFTGAYDPAGALVSQTYPNGLVAATTYDNTGDARSLTYAKGGVTWYRDQTHTDAHGQTNDHASTASAQDYTYDPAGRLTVVKDTDPLGQCSTRSYTFNPNSTRATLVTATGDSDGTCQTSGATTTSWTYDTADRTTNPGYTYDTLGRTLTVPAGDLTNGTDGGTISVGYYANDMVRSQTQGTQAKTFTLDPMRRLRSATDTTNGAQTRQITNHYDTTGDSPAWIATDTTTNGVTTSTWQRNIEGLNGDLAALQSPTGTPVLQLTNLHGDVIATTDDDTTVTSTTATYDTTEYGTPRDAANAPDRYGWLGAKQRSGDDLAGLILMGVRLYNPATGRFLSTDPITGGNTNDYAYPVNPIDMFDLDGKFGFRNHFKKHWRTYLEVGLTVASFVPGVGVAAWGYRGYRVYRAVNGYRSVRAALYVTRNRSRARAVSSVFGRGSFKNSARSFVYHHGKHGGGRSARRYLGDAQRDLPNFARRGGHKFRGRPGGTLNSRRTRWVTYR